LGLDMAAQWLQEQSFDNAIVIPPRREERAR
jgi:hypothetical protein